MEELPRPTVWPAALALGVTFMLWGLLTSGIISAIGGVVTACAVVGWVGELRDAHHG